MPHGEVSAQTASLEIVQFATVTYGLAQALHEEHGCTPPTPHVLPLSHASCRRRPLRASPPRSSLRPLRPEMVNAAVLGSGVPNARSASGRPLKVGAVPAQKKIVARPPPPLPPT